MKTVFENKQLAHIWAHKSQANGRNSNSSFYFEHDTIYSYGRHFPIAKHVVNENGEVAVLFTERTYSNTTQRHISLVRHACYQDIIFCHNPDNFHSDNFSSWVTECEEIAANLKRARKPEKYLNQISYIGDKANKYASFFGISIPDTLQRLIGIENHSQFEEYRENKKALLNAEEKKKAAQLKKDHKKELNKWLSGQTNVLYLRNGFDYLRIRGENVETSQGIKLPIDYAKKLYLSLQNGTFKEGSKVFDYQVTEATKTIKIGCHTFKREYLLKFGSKL